MLTIALCHFHVDVPTQGTLTFTHTCVYQVLNEYFHNVCELDLVFNFYKVD